MSQPAGFAAPIDALLAVATCLGDFTIPNESGTVDLEPRMFVGDAGQGGVIDCCLGGKPVLRVESTGELPASGAPFVLGKHGCLELVMGITVTFLTCFKTISKAGTVVTDPDDLKYGLVLQAARWRAVGMLRCCRPANIKFVSAIPIPSDGKCSGFQIDLLANLTLCGECAPAPVSE